MARWEDMTDEERERYINQDVVKTNSREVLCSSGRFSHYCEAVSADNQGLASVFVSTGYLPSDSILYSLIDPVAMECLRMFYGEGYTYNQIADAILVQYVADGRVICSKKFTRNIVWKKLLSGRIALKKLLGEDFNLALREFEDLKDTAHGSTIGKKKAGQAGRVKN